MVSSLNIKIARNRRELFKFCAFLVLGLVNPETELAGRLCDASNRSLISQQAKLVKLDE